jgi:hypothetical protein
VAALLLLLKRAVLETVESDLTTLGELEQVQLILVAVAVAVEMELLVAM